MIENAAKVSAALAGRNGSDVHRRERALCCERIRKQGAIPDALTDVADDWPQAFGGGSFAEQVERFENRQTGLEQSVELLVENQEILGADGPIRLGPGEMGNNVEMAANAVDVETPVSELLSRFSLRLGGFDLIENPAGDIPTLQTNSAMFFG